MTIHAQSEKIIEGAVPDAVSLPKALIDIRRLEVNAAQFKLDIAGLRLEAGGRAILVGPNGAGKTTLFESLLGLRRTTAVDGEILGLPVADWANSPKLRRRIGVQLQQGLYPGQLSAEELIAMHEAMYGATNRDLADGLALAELGRRPYRDLSHGQRQRLNLYMALAHRPELTFLDEPFAGLDQHTIEVVTAQLRVAGPGGLILIGHTVAELALADTLIQMRAGQIVRIAAVSDMLAQVCGGAKANVRFSNAEEAERFAAESRQKPFVLRVQRPGPLVVSCFGGPELKASVLRAVQSSSVTDFGFGSISLNDLLSFCSEADADA